MCLNEPGCGMDFKDLSALSDVDDLLDLYSTQPSAFDGQAEIVGEWFAAHAAIAPLGSTQHSEWQAALNSRDIVAMAKGILVNRDDLTDDQAFRVLVSTSQYANMKVDDVASWLVAETNNTARGRRE